MVQGSRQARIFITSELRTDNVGCADLRPITRIRVLTVFRQNKSGTAEVMTPLSLIAV